MPFAQFNTDTMNSVELKHKLLTLHALPGGTMSLLGAQSVCNRSEMGFIEAYKV